MTSWAVFRACMVAGLLLSQALGVSHAQDTNGTSKPDLRLRKGKRLEGYDAFRFGATFAETMQALGGRGSDIGVCEMGMTRGACIEFTDTKDKKKLVATALFENGQMRMVRVQIRPLSGGEYFSSNECWDLVLLTAVQKAKEIGPPDDGFPIKRSEMRTQGSNAGDPNNLLVGEAIFTFPLGGSITVSGVDTPAADKCRVTIWYEK